MGFLIIQRLNCGSYLIWYFCKSMMDHACTLEQISGHPWELWKSTKNCWVFCAMDEEFHRSAFSIFQNYIGSGKEQILKVYYLPGVPEVFQRTFQIQVAHLEPDRITLKGQGVFPRICLDLPRNIHGKSNSTLSSHETNIAEKYVNSLTNIHQQYAWVSNNKQCFNW